MNTLVSPAPFSHSWDLSSGSPQLSTPSNSILARLSPTTRRRMSATGNRFNLAAASSTTDIRSFTRAGGVSASISTGSVRRYSANLDRQKFAFELPPGQWKPPVNAPPPPPESDLPGLLCDLQVLCKKLVLEHKQKVTYLVLGRDDEDDEYETGSPGDFRFIPSPDLSLRGSIGARAQLQTLRRSVGVNAPPTNPRYPNSSQLTSVTSEDKGKKFRETNELDEQADELDEQADADRQIVDPIEKEWFNHVNAKYVKQMEKMLAEEDIYVDRRDHFTGFTALHWASKFGHHEMLKLCLDSKANVNLRTHSGCSALHLASKGGHADVCVALLDAGANANMRDSHGKLPYHVAHKKIPEAIKERMLKGVNHNATKALTLLNIQVKKSSSSVNAKISLSTSRTRVDEDDMPNSKMKSSWFKRKLSSQLASTSQHSLNVAS